MKQYSTSVGPAAEHHGLQARIASWKGNMAPPGDGGNTVGDAELPMAQAKPRNVKLPTQFPDMPWKKKPPVGQSGPTSPGPS